MSESSSGEQEDRQASRTCPVIQRFLPLLALQELRPRLERAVYLHLATCESCTAELEQYEDVMRLLRASRKRSGRQKNPGDSNHPDTTTSHEGKLHVPDLTFEPSPGQDDSIVGAVPGNTAPPSPRPIRADSERGAMAFARSCNENFRHAFAEALVDGIHASPFPQTNDAPGYAASSAHPSGKGKSPQRLTRNDTPSDVFATAVSRSLAAIAQQWHDPEHPSKSEDHDIC